MDGVDDKQRYDEDTLTGEQSPSLLTIILDTNPAAWALLQPTLSISNAIAVILVFINAHLACNYTNQVAVIASHCDKAQWLFPTAAPQFPPSRQENGNNTRNGDEDHDEDEGLLNRNKRPKLNGSHTFVDDTLSASLAKTNSNKYRPFRLIEEELLRNLKTLLSSTSPESLHEKTSTMIAGALTLALSYINRRSQEYRESFTGVASSLADQSATQAASTDPTAPSANTLQSRILIITLSPSTDLAHQYIPIMNSIFACQRLNIPIDVLQLPLPPDPNHISHTSKQVNILPETSISSDPNAATAQQPHQTSTVFLQQAADATHGIFIPAILAPPQSQSTTNTTTTTPAPAHETHQKTATQSLLTYLLTALLPSPTTRSSLHTPTLISIDFRAACFCHRNVISLGYVCSICLSIFCDLSLATLADEGCLTCGTKLAIRDVGIGGLGKTPVVVPPRKRKKKKDARRDGGSNVGTPTASPMPV